MKLKALTFVLSLIIGISHIANAAYFDNPRVVTVKLAAQGSVNAQLNESQTATISLNGKETEILWNPGWDANNLISSTVETPRLKVGTKYTLTMTRDLGFVDIKAKLSVDEGYRIIMDDVAQTYDHWDVQPGDGISRTAIVQVVPIQSLQEGQILDPTIGSSLTFHAGMGMLPNGDPIGSLFFRERGHYLYSQSRMLRPDTLDFGAPINDESLIEIHSATNGYSGGSYIRQIKAPFGLANIVLESANSYRIDYYFEHQISGSIAPYSINTAQHPFVRIKVDPGSATAEFRITYQELNSTGAVVNERYWEYFLTDAVNYNWKLESWSGSDLYKILTKTNTTVSGNRVETTKVLEPDGSTVTREWKKTFKTYQWSEELLKEEQVFSLTESLVRQFVYYVDDNTSSQSNIIELANGKQEGNTVSYGKVAAVVQPNGKWVHYTYASPTTLTGKPYVYETVGYEDSGLDIINNPSIRTTYLGGLWNYDLKQRPTSEATQFLNVHNNAKIGRKERYSELDETTFSYPVFNIRLREFYGDPDSANNYYEDKHYIERDTEEFDEEDWLYAGKPLADFLPSGRKSSFIYKNGISFNETTRAYSLSTSGNYWIEIRLNGATQGGATLSSYLGDDIEDLSMISNKSTISVKILNRSGREVYSEQRVWTGSGTGEILNWSQTIYDTGRKLPVTVKTSSGLQTSYQYVGQLASQMTSPNGTTLTYQYDGFARLIQETKRDNIQDLVSSVSWYDAADQLLHSAKVSGKLSTIPSSPAGLSGEALVASTLYDTAGRKTSETSVDGLEIQYEYIKDVDGFFTEIKKYWDGPSPTNPLASSVERNEISTYYRDSRIKRKYGNAVVEKNYTYGFSNFTFWEKEAIGPISSSRYVKSYKDLLGRTVKIETPAWNSQTLIAETSYYHSGYGQGQAHKTWDNGVAGDSLSTYDVMGNSLLQGLDISGNGVLDLSSSDRISELSKSFFKDGTDWYLDEVNYVYPVTNSSAKKIASKKRTRLSGFGVETIEGVSSQLVEEIHTWGASGSSIGSEDPVFVTKKYLSSSTGKEISQAFSPGIANPSVTIKQWELVRETRMPSGTDSHVFYDSLERPERTVGRENTASDKVETKIVYVTGTNLISANQHKNIAGSFYDISSFTYFDDLSIKSSKNANNKFSYFLYNTRGQLTHQWGNSLNPAKYSFNDYGERTELHTYRSGTWTGSALPSGFAVDGDKTTWTFDASTGLLSNTKDAANKGKTFTYTLYGEPSVVTNARSQSVTHSYDAKTRALTSKNYSGSVTSDVSYTYNRLGNQATITDYLGTRTYTYDPDDFQLIEESMPSGYGVTMGLEFSYTNRRLDEIQLGDTDTDRFYKRKLLYHPSEGRISSIRAYQRNSTTYRTFSYTYQTDADKVRTVSSTGVGGQTYSIEHTLEPNLNSPGNTKNKWGTTTYAEYDYDYNILHHVQYEIQSGSMFDEYGAQDSIKYEYAYTDRNELSRVYGYLHNGTSWTSTGFGRSQGYTYDAQGNRTDMDMRYASTTDTKYDYDYTANNLNQYTYIRRPSYAVYNGVQSENVWLWDGQREDWVTTDSSYPEYPSEVTKPANGSYFECWFDSTTQAIDPNSSSFSRNLWDDALQEWFNYGFSPLQQSPTYDDDGNLTNMGSSYFEYDVDNRLISIFAEGRKLEFEYDYLGRRVEERRYDDGYGVRGGGTLLATRRFIYHGMEMIAVVEKPAGGNASVTNTYFWGIDRSESLAGVGGIGGLLLIDNNGSRFLPGIDGNGNLTLLVSESTGALSAEMEYDPFGQSFRFSGEFDATPFRYQSKWHAAHGLNDTNWLDFYDFGFRFYLPEHGRFINRDPIGIAGGLNLYAYLTNNPIGHRDLYGFEEGEGQSVKGISIPENTAWVKYNEELPDTVTVVLQGADGATYAVTFDEVDGKSGEGYVEAAVKVVDNAVKSSAKTPVGSHIRTNKYGKGDLVGINNSKYGKLSNDEIQGIISEGREASGSAKLYQGTNSSNMPITSFTELNSPEGEGDKAQREQPEDYAVALDISKNPAAWDSLPPGERPAQATAEHAIGFQKILDQHTDELGTAHVVTYTTSKELAGIVSKFQAKGVNDFYYIAHGTTSGIQGIWIDNSLMTEKAVFGTVSSYVGNNSFNLIHRGCRTSNNGLDYYQLQVSVFGHRNAVIQSRNSINQLFDNLKF